MPHARAKPWKDIWSAGQCVGTIKAIQTVAELEAALRHEYMQAIFDEQRNNPWADLYQMAYRETPCQRTEYFA